MSKNNKKDRNFPIGGIVVVILLVSLLILFALEKLFQNNVYSALTNGEWSGFLGSYLGGIFSGAGTLYAVYLTTKETRTIQEQNAQKIEDDRALFEKKERKQFSDGIAEDVARYVTDISKFFYTYREYYTLYNERNKLNKELQTIEQKILDNLEIKKGLDYDKDEDEFRIIYNEIQILEQKETALRYQIDKKDNAIIDIKKPDRTIADQRYYLLGIRLKDIRHAESINEQLNNIYFKSSDFLAVKQEFIQQEANKLLVLTAKFIDIYVNEK